MPAPFLFVCVFVWVFLSSMGFISGSQAFQVIPVLGFADSPPTWGPGCRSDAVAQCGHAASLLL